MVSVHASLASSSLVRHSGENPNLCESYQKSFAVKDAIGVEINTEIASPVDTERFPQENDEIALDYEDDLVNDGTEINIKEQETKDDGECSEGEQEIKDDGECSEEEQETKDDGECSEGDDEDLEDGEINEDNEERKDRTNFKSNTTKPICKYWSRGQCFFYSNCKFQHINSVSGNYSIFAPSTQAPQAHDYYSSHGGMMSHRPGPLPPRHLPPRPRSDFLSSPPDFLPPEPAFPHPAHKVSASAWEKGLETARQLVRRANKRKREEGPDFSEQSLNLPLIASEKNVPEFLDNDASYQRRERDKQYPKYDEPVNTSYDHYETKNSLRQGFEGHYHRGDHRRGNSSRNRMDNRHNNREFPPKSSSRSNERFQAYDRLQEVEPPRRDANAYFDPWRRSKSPTGTARKSRSRSYSSVSSSSWSDKSFSSKSYKDSSRSGSRSVSPSRSRIRSRSRTASRSRTRSRSRTASRSRSRSFSRSISMSSVSSASSRDSLSQNSSSVLRKQDKNPTPPVLEESERDPLEEQFLASKSEPFPFPSLKHLLPTRDKSKEPLKVAPCKPKIKLTLLNKNPQQKGSNMPKKKLDNNDPEKAIGHFGARKSPSPPMPSDVTRPTPVLIPQKNANSRRDELLKQLKAVEDAIVRKRKKN